MSALRLQRRLLCTALAGALVFGLSGCGEKEAPREAALQKKELPVIGIVQLVEHEALDASVKGFIDHLASKGYKEGETVVFDRQNAQGDQETLKNIAARFVSKKVNLIFSVSTPATQAMARATRDIPIVATAVTSFTAAKVAATNEKPGGNVTGVSNVGPIAEQFGLLKTLVGEKGEGRPFGVIYNAGEVNAVFQVDIFKEAAKKEGVEILEATISSVNDIQQAVVSLNGKVSGYWFPTDNFLASGVGILAKHTLNAKVPTVPGDSALVRGGLLATMAVDYYTLGLMSGAKAIDILEGKSKPADMPIERQKPERVIVNMANAKAIGLTIPEEILRNADVINP